MARAVSQVTEIDIELDDGMAFGMGEGFYLVVQQDECGRRHAVLLSANDMAAIDATERERAGIAATLRDATEGALEARTALWGLSGQMVPGGPERALVTLCGAWRASRPGRR